MRHVAMSCAAALSALPAAAFAQPSFTPLGFLDAAPPVLAPLSEATDISADGLVVVGYSILGDQGRAFRWSNNVMTALPELAGVPGASAAFSVNSNGSIIAGDALGVSGVTAVKWQGGAAIDLNAGVGTSASAVSDNGSIAFGLTATGTAFRSSSGASADIGDVDGGFVSNLPGRCTPSGELLVGEGDDGNSVAYLWNNGSYTVLPDLPGGVVSASATDISDNGAYVVGKSAPTGANFGHACRWMLIGGIPQVPIDLGELPGGANLGFALGVSGDGSVVVGYSSTTNGAATVNRAFIRDQSNGMRRLDAVLTGLGVSIPAGWQLERAVAVSGDGLVIAGYGKDPSNRTQAFVANLRTQVICPADLDNGSGTGVRDGGVDINDLLYFLTVFESGATAADLDNGSDNGVPDGGVDINDLLYFLVRFEGGC